MINFGGIDVAAIGDSNTYGFGDADVIRDGAWRYYFGSGILPYLKANPNWVGQNPALGTGTAGNRMIGAIGQRVDTILSTYEAANQFLYYRPSIAIFMIGVNDCNQLYTGTWAGSITESIANMSTLLDAYRTACPTGIAVVSRLPPSTTSGVNDNIVLWNAALDVMIAARSDLTYLFVADLYTAFTNNASWATEYMSNFLHYNEVGQQLIANTFISTLTSNVNTMPRATANPRRAIKPHTASLRYTTSTATTLGTGTVLDSTQPWAVSMDINLERQPTATTNSLLCLETDQATPFVFLTNASNIRFVEFGSSANFGRFFPPSTAAGDLRAILWKGWHQMVVVYDGVSRTASSSYKIYVDAVNYPITSGAGLGASTDQNAIGSQVGAAAGPIFDMADLTIWSGGTAMTAAQVADWYNNYTLPSGPTLIRRYQHTDASGSVLTDSTGNQNGTIGTASWNSSVPTQARASLSTPRTTATTRTIAS